VENEFGKAEYNGSLVKNWEYFPLAKPNCRLYFNSKRENDENNGFDFAVIEIVQGSEDNSFLDNDSFESLLFGTANYAGLLDIFFSCEKEQLTKENASGYVYRLNPGLFVQIFQKLKELELRYCNPTELILRSNF
jgi:hypothetical protein